MTRPLAPERPVDAVGPSPQTVERGIERRPVHRYAGALQVPVPDEIVVEAPLEIRVAGDPIATTMRTPGADPALALGFLYAEGVIDGAADVGSLVHCGDPTEDDWGNVLEVRPGPGVVLDPTKLAASRRGTLVTSACGVCGRASIDDLLARVPERPRRAVAAERLAEAPERLRAAQPAFARTGALHAAAAIDDQGVVVALAEDVGRHNAVDKVVGRLVQGGLVRSGLAPSILAVSGRTSFEIVQKAVAAGFAAVVSVSGPSTLAIDLAERAGLVLAGFARGGRLNVYAGVDRLRTPEEPTRENFS